MHFLYNILIRLFIFGMKILALFNNKAKLGISGRKQSLSVVTSAFSPQEEVIWMHAASLGEYEQGVPVLEKLKENFPSCKILVTFFSPSGYENVIKKKHIADAVCYLPFDRKKDIEEFVSAFRVKLFFTVKYDFWYTLFEVLKQKNAKILVISALFYEHQTYFTTLGKWQVKQLKKNVDWIFHQTERSYFLANSIGLHKGSVAGDTRFDRVKFLRKQNNFIEQIPEFIQNKKTVVFGSSWQAEEKMAKLLLENRSDIKIIIAPHDLKRVSYLQEIFPNALLHSQLKVQNLQDFSAFQVLIIDSIGLLSRLYSYADIAVVGGGFHRAGLHNILEAATFGVPVFFGNQYRKNPEADALIEARGGKSFAEEDYGANFICALFEHESLRQEMAENAANFIISQPNATQIILEKIQLL